MIFGECPNCDEPVCNSFAGAGQMQRIVCDACHKPYWLKHSRLDPEAFTEADFAEQYEVDEATKTIKDKAREREKASRAANPAIWALIDARVEACAAELAHKLEQNILYGTPLV